MKRWARTWSLKLLLALCRAAAETDSTPVVQASHPHFCSYQDPDPGGGCSANSDDTAAASSTASPSLFQGAYSRHRLPFSDEAAGELQGSSAPVANVSGGRARVVRLVRPDLGAFSGTRQPAAPAALAGRKEGDLRQARPVPEPHVPEPQERGGDPGVALLSLLDTVRRRLREEGLKASGQVAVLARTRSGSVMIAAAVVLLIGFLFCLASFVHAFVYGLKQDKQEPRAVRAPRADMVPSAMASTGPSRPMPQQGSSPTPRNMSAVSVKPHAKRQPSADTPRRFVSTDSLAPSSRSVPEDPVYDADGTYLCPELVVPEGSECTLLVPRVSLSGSGIAPVSISDARGVPVFKAVFAVSSTHGRNRPEIKRLVLSSATGDAIFAFCRDAEVDASTGQAGLAIFHYSDVPFGDIRADGPRPANGYSVTSRRGWRLRFRGDPEGRNLNATDEHGRLLAITEAHAPARRSVRIGPLVDAGLIAISVLGIDLLGQGFAESQRI